MNTPAWSFAAYGEKDVEPLAGRTPVPCVVKPEGLKTHVHLLKKAAR